MIFGDWTGLYRTLVTGVLAYAVLVLFLRFSGKRTLSKWNAFDFIVTVALGSSLATAILSNQVPLVQGVLGFGVLILLQFSVTWLSVRSKTVRELVKANPTLLLHKGQFLEEILKRERVTESEIRAALREKGIGDVAEVEAVVLETDGSFSVIKETGQVSRSTLVDVSGFEQQS